MRSRVAGRRRNFSPVYLSMTCCTCGADGAPRHGGVFAVNVAVFGPHLQRHPHHTERIRVKSNQAKAAGEGVSDGIVEEADLSRFFPSFVWVLRDFALMLHDEVRICLCPSSRGSSFSATAVVRLC